MHGTQAPDRAWQLTGRWRAASFEAWRVCRLLLRSRTCRLLPQNTWAGGTLPGWRVEGRRGS